LIYKLSISFVKKTLKNTRGFSSKALIICLEPGLELSVQKLRENKSKNFEYIGTLAVDRTEGRNDGDSKIKVLELVDEFERIAMTEILDDVVILVKNLENLSIERYVEICRNRGLGVHILFDAPSTALQQRISSYKGFISLSLYNNRFTTAQLFIKRIIDILGSIVGLIITAVFTIFLAPLIKLDSKGPVFFSQWRVGENGRQFKIYKFRSMISEAEAIKKQLEELNEMKGGIFKIKDDPRVTNIGKFIRSYSIDEFPQFLNVFKGEMSIVGTRPPTVDEVKGYELAHLRRISIKPGLTGIWQISGRNEISDFEQIMVYDLDYIKNWSIWLDLKIIAKTIFVVLKKSGY
jgi:exopolysaccharide biosynthesis polyprenyl glycosylphosphotransferase